MKEAKNRLSRVPERPLMSGALKSQSSGLVKDGSRVFFVIYFLFTVSLQLSLGPTDWWIGLSIGPPGQEVRCVGILFWSLYPISVTVSEKMLMLFYKCQT